MNCHERQQPITLLAAGCLDGAERAEITLHLAECAGCRARFQAARRLCGRLAGEGAAREARPSPGFHARIAESIARPARPQNLRWQWLAPLAAAVCVALLVRVEAPQTPKKCAHPAEPSPQAATEAEQTLPTATCLDYLRAAAVSDAAFEALLARDAAKVLPPDHNSISPFNFRQLANL